MTAKEYLKQVYRLDQMIDCHLNELENLKEKATIIKAVNFDERISTGTRSTEAPFTKTVHKIIDLQNRINGEIDTLVDLKAELENAIECLEDTEEKLLLRYRYISNMKWEDISETLNVSLRTVYRIHDNALRHFKAPQK